jgi:uncharacterized protein
VVGVKEDLEISTAVKEGLLALNNAHARELSWLDAAQLTHLVRAALIAWRIGIADAFLLAFDQDAAYDNANFSWFHARFDRFIYIDRVVVAASARGRGYARLLYAQVCAVAAEKGYPRVVCEVNSSPPNPASDAFHHSMGFAAVGTATIHGGAKTVRYLVREI